jgi:hypothetical protein
MSQNEKEQSPAKVGETKPRRSKKDELKEEDLDKVSGGLTTEKKGDGKAFSAPQ